MNTTFHHLGWYDHLILLYSSKIWLVLQNNLSGVLGFVETDSDVDVFPRTKELHGLANAKRWYICPMIILF